MIDNAIEELKYHATEYNGLGMDPDYFDELIRTVQADAFDNGFDQGHYVNETEDRDCQCRENPYRN